MKGKTIVVWFSCGAASAVAAKLTINKYGAENTVRVVNTPVKEEHEDNRRFLRDVERWIGQEIEIQVNSKFPNSSCVEVWDKRKYMAGVNGAPCTLELKKGARYEFERNNEIDYHVLGFTAKEKSRHERFTQRERANVLPVLIDRGWTKDDCFWVLNDVGIKLPEIYLKGFPNANCIGCVKSQSPTYWNRVRKEFPEVFNHRAEQSRRIGAKLVNVKGKRIFLDELKPTDLGGDMPTWSCGLFCNED